MMVIVMIMIMIIIMTRKTDISTRSSKPVQYIQPHMMQIKYSRELTLP